MVIPEKTRQVFRLLAIYGAAAAFWLLVLLYVTPVVPSVTRVLTDRWETPAGDVLIVLSADQLGDGTLGVGSYWRTVYAVRAWRAGMCKRIVFSGGYLGAAESGSVAAAMGQFAVGLGVPADVIVLEERSRSTRENALFTANTVRSLPGSKVLMTSDYHMLRARLTFERAGIAVRSAPIPDVGKRWNGWTTRWDCIWTVSGELIKLAYYRTKGWV